MYNEYPWEMKYIIVYAVDPFRRENNNLKLLIGKESFSETFEGKKAFYGSLFEDTSMQ